MTAGLNHNLKHNGKLYHVQTECRHSKNEVFIESQVFIDGAIIFQNKESCNADESNQSEMIERLHKKSIYDVLMGIKKEPGKKSEEKSTSKMSTSSTDQASPAKSSKTEKTLTAPLENEPQSAGGRLYVEPVQYPKHKNAENRIEKAQKILAELSATRGLNGLGVFSGDGKIISTISTLQIDFAEISQAYLEAKIDIEKVSVKNNMGEMSVLQIAAESGSIVLLSFKPFFKELVSDYLQGALGYVIIHLEPALDCGEIIKKVQFFMILISDELKIHIRESTKKASLNKNESKKEEALNDSN